MHSQALTHLQVVNFSTRDFQGCIDINNITKVISMPKLSLAPAGPEYVIGLVNLAGSVIPVIDLSMRLHISSPNKYSIDTPILICKNSKGDEFGVIVSRVYDIASVTQEMIQDDISTSRGNQIIRAAVKYHDSISLLIDVNLLLDGDTDKNK